MVSRNVNSSSMRRSATGCPPWALSMAMYTVAFGLLLSYGGLQFQPVDALSADGHILLEMKQSLLAVGTNRYAGSSSGLWGGWDETDSNPCAWAGVRCNNNLTVEALDLAGWFRGGTFIGEQVLSLHSLKELDVSGNKLSGSLPDWIGDSSLLIRLDVSGNSLAGEIPPSINKLQHLRFLSLQDNYLEGEIPFLGGLSSLQFLSLSGNYLTGQVPDLQNLTNLVSLDLSRNLGLGGEIPQLLGLTHLESLDLSGNNFSAVRDFSDLELKSLANLKRLNMSSNYEMEGPIPAGVMLLPSMESLDLSQNLLSGEIPEDTTWGNKYYLDLSENNLQGRIPAGLLRSTGKFPATLKLSKNSLGGWIPMPRACSASSPCDFETLDLSYNRLVGTISLPQLSSISYLYLRGNQLSGDINNLLQGPYMRELHLGYNDFTGDINITRLTSLYRLFVLNLGNNSGLSIKSTPEWPHPLQIVLEQIDQLMELRLPGVDLSNSGGLPTSLEVRKNLDHEGQWRPDYSLGVMDLSNCRLEGELSEAFFGGLRWLRDLDLSSNRLHGPVPANLTGLSLLKLSNNSGLCDGPLAPCTLADSVHVGGLKLGVLLTVVGVAVLISVSSCILLRWRWKVYARKHQQDADLIATLLERDAATLMPLRELKKATANFSDSCQIGVGGFGTVYMGELCDGTTVAIKRSNKPTAVGEDKKEFLNEVRILSLVNHRHLVKLLGCCLENKISVLVFEYVSNGTLLDHLRGKKGDVSLSWKHRLRIAVQTADALNYLHCAANPPIFHRDVKSANILLDANLNAKVADFGISKLAPLDATHVSTVRIQGTMGYIDPEYYTSFQLTAKSDVYSFGVVLLELISTQSVVDIKRGYEDANLVSLALRLNSCEDLQKLIDPELLGMKSNSGEAEKESMLSVGKLAIQCLAMRSKQRPNMREVLKQLQSLWVQYDAEGTTQGLDYIHLEIPDSDNGSTCGISDSSSYQFPMTIRSAPNPPVASFGGWDSFQFPQST